MKSILLFGLLSVALFTQAQTIIKGTVTNEKQLPLPGASIILKGTYDGGITNTKGQFEFNTLKTGSADLEIRYVGYETKIIPLVLNGEPIELAIVIKEKFNELDAVTITAGAFEAGDKKKAVLLTSLDMVTTPGASGNVVNALQFLPGTSNNGESGKLFVRGGSSEESKTFIDGAIVHNPYNASAPNTSVRSRFNPFMFKGTVFSTGGFSAEYGQALSSVLLLETKEMQEEDQLDISLLSVGLGLAGTKKWKNTTVTASIDYTNLTPYMKIVPQGIEWQKMPESVESAISFRQKTKSGLLKVYGNFSQSHFNLFDLNLNSKTNDQFDLKNRNTYINSSYKGKLTENWIIKLSGAYTNYVESVNINSDLFEEETNGTHFKTKLTRAFSKQFKLNTGVELFSNQFSQSYITQTDNIKNKFTNNHLGGFLEFDWYLSKNLVARLGGRLDHSDYLQTSKLSPRGSIAYKLNKYHQMSFAYGHFYQTPQNDFLLYSNQLEFELAKQYMVNYTFTKNKRSFRAEAYYKPYENLVKFNNDEPFYLPDYYTNQGNGSAYGFDLFFRDRKTIKNGDYWVSYSYLDTKRDYLNFPHEAQPRFASKHNLSIVYKHWIRKWRTLFGASFNYASPRVYNDPNESVFNNQKMKAFQSLNLNASFLYREHIIFYASATNVLGYKQEYGYRFSDIPNSEGVYEKSLIQPPADRFFVLGCFITLSKAGDKNQLDKIN